MKRLLRYRTIWFLLLLTIAAGTGLTAQTRIISSLDVEDNLTDIVFRNSNVGYGLAGQSVWETRDGGETWEPTMPLVFRPYFTAMGTFGENGMIIGDEMGGIHIALHPDSMWVSTKPIEGVPITEIEVVDGKQWAAIAGPTLFITDDGGATYRQFTPDERQRLSALDITDASLMHVCQDAFNVWRSTDFGKTWSKLKSIAFEFGLLYDVQFTSPDTGLVASWYPWNVFTTFDGGETWTEGPFDYPTSIAMGSSGIAAYTTKAKAQIWLSYDKGRSWTDTINTTQLKVDDDSGVSTKRKQKIIALNNNALMLLLSNPETNRSVIAKLQVDGSASAVEETRTIEGELDLH